MTWSKLGRALALLAATAALAGIGFGLAPRATHDVPFLGYEVSDDQMLVMPAVTEAMARRGGAARGAPSDEKDDGEHDLMALRLVSRALLLVQENYVDPERVQPKKMLLGSLDHIEKRIPEVLVDAREAEETGRVVLTVNRATRELDLTEVTTLWDIPPRLRDIFAFIQENLVSTEDTRRIEYAAINGMLSTLDPHSNLLDPEQYSDMKMTTRGEFGGLGFVVSMRDGRLTVMRIIPNTPAHEGGVKARDVILRIEDDSTMNMDLTEAVSRLRGKPGTPVSFSVERPNEEEVTPFTLTRAIIEIESIDPVHLLEDSVGYVRVTNFQGNTTRDLRKAIAKLEEEAEGKLKGLVLDLRGNPGGLLEQAIQVADVFVDRGTIVSTVGMNNRLRERKPASRQGSLTKLPLAVLVSNNSASASEIVGGAVKNLDRGIVMGNATFGKGSVQVLYDLVDDSALKLTIAQYLTAGDVSIQDLGIVPDIDLLPALVSPNRVMVFAPRRSLREVDLEAAYADPAGLPGSSGIGLDPFRAPGVADDEDDGQKPLQTITFLRDDVPDDEEIDEFEEPEWQEDFHVRFARRLLAEAGASSREKMLEKARPVIDSVREEERRRIYDAVSLTGVDWSPATSEAKGATSEAKGATSEAKGATSGARVEASLSFDGPATAGEETHVSLTLTNTGDQPVHRVRAWTEANIPRVIRYSMLFDRLEFLFGRLEPGESRTWRVPVTLPTDLTARTEKISIRVEGDGLENLATIPAALTVDERSRPVLAFNYQVSGGPNGDGALSVGGNSQLDLLVSNVGVGTSKETIATIRSLDEKHVDVDGARHRIGELDVGSTERAPMRLTVREGFEGAEVRLRVTIYDRETAQIVSDEIEVPVSRAPVAVEQVQGTLRFNERTPILRHASPGSGALASADAGATVPVLGKVNGMLEVRWAEGCTGFVPADAGRHQARGAGRLSGEIEPLFPHRPPRIELAGDERAPVAEGGTFLLSGVAEAEGALRDVYIFVNNDKVFFRAWQPPTEPPTSETAVGNGAIVEKESEDGVARLPFEVALPLQEGANSVVVFARVNDELLARRQMVVFRTPEALVEGSESSTAGDESSSTQEPDGG